MPMVTVKTPQGQTVTVNEVVPGIFGSIGYTYVNSGSGGGGSTPSSTTSGSSSSGGSSGSSTPPNYTIQSGDTLTGIAAKFGTTIDDLLKLNPSIKDEDTIYAGSILNLPATPVKTPEGNNTTPIPPALAPKGNVTISNKKDLDYYKSLGYTIKSDPNGTGAIGIPPTTPVDPNAKPKTDVKTPADTS
jgi:LysM repeat protein